MMTGIGASIVVIALVGLFVVLGVAFALVYWVACSRREHEDPEGWP